MVTFGAICLDQVVALIEVLDGKLHALELILALYGVGARTRHGSADRDRVALRAGRPSADGRLVIRVRPADLAYETGNQTCAGDASPELQHAAARKTARCVISQFELYQVFLP